jgi:ribonuclease Z
VAPGPLYRLFKESHDPVRLPDGRIVDPKLFRGPDVTGRAVCILGDTCDPSAIAPIARGVDLLVHEATVVETDRKLAPSRGHSTASSFAHWPVCCSDFWVLIVS